MRVQYQMAMDQSYFDAAYARYRKQHPARPYFDVVKWLGLAVLGGSLAMAASRPAWMPMATLVTFIALIWFSPRLEQFFRRRQIRRSPYLNEEAALTFSDEGVAIQSRLANSICTWDNFTRAVRFSDGWLLFSGPQLFRWLPDSALVNGAKPLDADALIRRQVADVRVKS